MQLDAPDSLTEAVMNHDSTNWDDRSLDPLWQTIYLIEEEQKVFIHYFNKPGVTLDVPDYASIWS